MKILAWIAVFVLNAFFVYYTLIMGLQRGREFQRSLVVASVAQGILEIWFYETTECIVLNYFIPLTIMSEMQIAKNFIIAAIKKLCANDKIDTTELPNFNAPDFLSVARNVALRYPCTLGNTLLCK